jgi:N-acetylneuraminic acid mutarotase
MRQEERTMPWKLSVVLFFALASLVAPSAFAQSSGSCSGTGCCDYNGLYVGLGGGYAWEDFGGGNAGNSAVANGRIGYRFLDYLALEGMGEGAIHFNGTSGQFNSAHTRIATGWINGKIYPTARLTGAIQPYALAGAGWMFERTAGGPGGTEEDNGVAGRFGGGIDFFLTEHLFLTIDGAYVLPADHVSELKHAIAGGAIQYRF